MAVAVCSPHQVQLLGTGSAAGSVFSAYYPHLEQRLATKLFAVINTTYRYNTPDIPPSGLCAAFREMSALLALTGQGSWLRAEGLTFGRLAAADGPLPEGCLVVGVLMTVGKGGTLEDFLDVQGPQVGVQTSWA